MPPHRATPPDLDAYASPEAAGRLRARPPLAAVAGAQEWWIRSMQTLLEPAGYAILRLRSGRQVLDYVEHSAPDLLLVNTELSDTGGIALCETMQERGLLDPTTPVLVLSNEHADRGTRLEALRAGAWDYLAYPYDAEELLARIDRYVRARMAADQQREVSLLDPETGLYSVSGIVRRARELGMYAIRHHRALGCAAVGLAAPPPTRTDGEDPSAALPAPPLIASLAESLTAVARSSDIVGRLGRCEFVVLAPETGQAGVLGLARRILEGVPPRIAEALGRPVRLRAGCYAVADGSQSLHEPVEVVARATVALRKAYLEPTDAPYVFT